MTRRVIFLCWGNICRSPMAMFMARAAAPASLSGVEFTSAGVSDEEEGNPIDPRAERELTRQGVPVGPHVAHVITRGEAEAADLVVAMTPEHAARLRRISSQATVALMNDFNPDAGSPAIDDPWYGAASGFTRTYDEIAAALPGLFARLGAGHARD